MNQPHPNPATEERLAWLQARLGADGSVSIVGAATALGVSEMTVRRDIAELEERGLARRVRGGAMPLGPQTFATRKSARTRAKARIAAKLATLLPAVGTVAFDASSTVMRAAALLTGARDLTVLTNGPETFTALQGRPGVTPVLTGGQLDPRTGSLVGPMACWSARQMVADLFVCSAAALDVSVGATEVTADEAEVKRSIASTARRVVLAVDASKLDHRAVAVGLDLASISLLVTELDPDDSRLTAYRALVEVR